MRILIAILFVTIVIQCNVETSEGDIYNEEQSNTSLNNDSKEIEGLIPNKKIEKKEFVDVNKAIDTITTIENILIQLDTMHDVFPDWVRASQNFQEMSMIQDCKFDDRMKPRILELDLNGDGELDIVFPIKNTQNNKIGFAIIHKGLYEHFIIGAGTKIKNGLSDDLNYIDIWKINKKKKNEPGLGEQKPLILKYNSIKIEKSDVGGGIVFWNGKEYEYFHQTC